MRAAALPLRPTLWVMLRNRAGADADGVTFSTTSNTFAPEPAMQLFSSSQFPWVNSKLPAAVAATAGTRLNAAGKPEPCGWYDSSFDLARGLEVSEEDNDTLYQLWNLSQQ